MSKVLTKLGTRFPPSAVKQRDGGRGLKLDYIDIPETIKRLREAAGMNVSWVIDEAKLTPTVIQKRDGPVDGWMAYVVGHLSVTEFPENEEDFGPLAIRNSTWGGVGAMTDTDPDMALKTAQAEAIKKAGHGFEIALYLWDPQEREAIQAYREATTSNDLNALKKAVAFNAKVRGVDPITPASLAEFYQVNEEELQDATTLRQLLEP